MILSILGGEIFMGAYDACRLIALNLYSFVDNPFTKNVKFNYDKLYEISYIQQQLADDLIDLELEHIDRIIEKVINDPEDASIKQVELDLWKKIRNVTESSRRTGCGFTALGDTLAALGLKYDSDEALEVVDKIMKTKFEAELDCTIQLAKDRGTFIGWNNNIEYKIKTYSDGPYDNTYLEGTNQWYEFILNYFPEQYERMQKYGRRQSSFSTVAPTGTVSLMCQTTSGIEPLFQPYYIRRKKINPNDSDVRVDFVDDNGDSWQEFPVLHPKFKDWMLINGNNPKDLVGSKEVKERILNILFKESPWYSSTANDINWEKRLKMQAIIQKYTTHSISSTINLPEDVSKEEVSNIYLKAYEYGLKGVTIYRDNCRTGVLVNESNKLNEFEYRDAPKRPKCLDVEIHTTVSKGTKWNVIVGLHNNKPYEVFAVPHFTNDKNMELCKVGNGRYDLIKDNEIYKEDFTSIMNDEEEVISRLASTALRHGADITFLVEQLNKTKGDITSLGKAIARTLKKYISEEKTLSRAKCSECGSTDLRMQEGCLSCNSCGSSKCGG